MKRPPNAKAGAAYFGAMGGKATGPRKRRSRAHYRRIAKLAVEARKRKALGNPAP